MTAAARKQGFPSKPPAGPKRSHQQRSPYALGDADEGKKSNTTPTSSFNTRSKIREMRLRFISPRHRGLNGLNAVEEVYRRVLEPMYGCQDVAVEKLRAGLDRDCRVAYDPKNDPSTARGMLAYKFLPSIEHASHGLKSSFELKTFLLMNTDDDDAMGYGTELLRYAAAKGLEAGADTMHITVSEEVASSVAFFIRRGFSIVHAWKGRYKPDVTEFLLAVSLQGKSLAKLRKDQMQKDKGILHDAAKTTDNPGSKPVHDHSANSKEASKDCKLESSSCIPEGSKKQRLGKEDSITQDAAQDIREGEPPQDRSPKSLVYEEDAENMDLSSDTVICIPPNCPLKPRARKGPLPNRFLSQAGCR